jgi:hypothetical protein
MSAHNVVLQRPIKITSGIVTGTIGRRGDCREYPKESNASQSKGTDNTSLIIASVMCDGVTETLTGCSDEDPFEVIKRS